MEGGTEIFDVPMEDDKQDEHVAPAVVVPPVQNNVLETPVPVVKKLDFSFLKQWEIR